MSSAVATTVLAYLPSPDRGVWYLGPVPIRAYALCIIAGIVIAVLWGERRFVARGGEPGAVVDIAVFAVPFGLVGGRLYHVATDWYTYFGPNGNPIDALKIWQGGLGIWGAIALGAVGAWIGCRRRSIPLPVFADAVAPGIVVAQAVGRLGNWFNQELYGAPTTLPWGLEIYRRVDPATGAPDPLGGVALDHTPVEIVQPTFLYELIWNLLVAALVVWADRRFRLGHGRAFALYVAGYTAGRFVIEQMRTDPATRVLGDLRVNVVVAAVVFVAAMFYVLLAKKGREVLDLGGPAGTESSDRGRERVGAGVGAGAAAAGTAAAGAVPLDEPVGADTPAADTPAADTPAAGTGTDGSEPSAAAEPAETPEPEAVAPPAEPAAVDAPDTPAAVEPAPAEPPAERPAEPSAAEPGPAEPPAEAPAETPAEAPAAQAPADEAAPAAADVAAPAADGTADPAEPAPESSSTATAEPAAERPADGADGTEGRTP